MTQQAPHVILYTTDQHRGDHLSIAGHPMVETPNVDAWIQQGAYFPNAYTEIPSTTGARRCLLGGQGSYDCGLIGYGMSEWHEPNTLAAVLADAGYHCLNVGWRNVHPRRKLYGFHHVIAHDRREGAVDYADWFQQQMGPRAHQRSHGIHANGWLGRPWPYAARYHPTNWTVDVTIEEIQKRDPTKPVFMWCSQHRPHSPYDPPQFFWDMYIDQALPPIPRGDWAARYDTPNPGLAIDAYHGRLTPAQYQRMRAGYMGCVTHIDYQLGYLMERMRSELGEDVLWIFTADHGDMQGDHYLMRKSYAYEGSARIPMVIRYPKGLDLPSGTFKQPVGLQDVMPTILDAAGVSIPDSVTGQSLLDAVRGKPWRDFIHGEHSSCYSPENAMHYLTDGQTKYIWFPVTGQEQLFDLAHDRQELHDLAGDPAWSEELVRWRDRLIDLLAERGDGFSDGERLIERPGGYGPEAQ